MLHRSICCTPALPTDPQAGKRWSMEAHSLYQPPALPRRTPTLLLARHAETVYNVAQRMQGWLGHTPLTHAGLAQAHAMGQALRGALGARPDIALWSSTAGRTQQTLAIIAEHLELDFFTAQADERLQEIHIGTWQGRRYADIVADLGRPIVDPHIRLFIEPPPQGEWYPQLAARLTSWLHDVSAETRPVLAISHGLACRVLRGLLVGGPRHSPDWPPIAHDVPQGSILQIRGGRETILHRGSGDAGSRRGA